MKRDLNIPSLVIGMGLTAIVIASPSFIRADADDFEADGAAKITVLSNHQRDSGLNNQTILRVPNDGHDSKQDQLNINQRQTGAAQNKGMEQDQSQSNQPTPVWLMRSSSLKRAAALRLAESGTKQIKAGKYEKAVLSLERALSIEANPYIYFYLAEAHYQLGHYQESLNFLEVAESWLMQQPDWAPQLVALKGQIPGSGITQQIFPGKNVELAVR
jgi:tetratricopeptide (TPR) repeat protein